MNKFDNAAAIGRYLIAIIAYMHLLSFQAIAQRAVGFQPISFDGSEVDSHDPKYLKNETEHNEFYAKVKVQKLPLTAENGFAMTSIWCNQMLTFGGRLVEGYKEQIKN